MTDEQREIMSHALGLGHSSREYRNHFVTGPGSTDYPHCEALVVAGLMRRREGHDGDPIYSVTEAGRVALRRPKTPTGESKMTHEIKALMRDAICWGADNHFSDENWDAKVCEFAARVDAAIAAERERRFSLSSMKDSDILAAIPMAGNFSQDERVAFCAGVRRCALHTGEASCLPPRYPQHQVSEFAAREVAIAAERAACAAECEKVRTEFAYKSLTHCSVAAICSLRIQARGYGAQPAPTKD